MARTPKPPKPPGDSTPPPPPAPPKTVQPRIFVVKVTADGAPDGDPIGYAITEQVGFVDLAGVKTPGLVVEEAELLAASFKRLFEDLAKSKSLYSAIGVPAERDPRGGFQMLTSAGGGSGGGGHGGGSN